MLWMCHLFTTENYIPTLKKGVYCFSSVCHSFCPKQIFLSYFSQKITDDNHLIFLCAVWPSGPITHLLISHLYKTYYLFTDLMYIYNIISHEMDLNLCVGWGCVFISVNISSQFPCFKPTFMILCMLCSYCLDGPWLVCWHLHLPLGTPERSQTEPWGPCLGGCLLGSPVHSERQPPPGWLLSHSL